MFDGFSEKKAFGSYQDFLALKRHFTSDYDYHKYKGKVKVSFAAFEKRRDRYQFHILGNLKNPKHVILSNLLVDRSMWVGDMVSEKGSQIHKEWRKRIDALSYQFSSDLSKLDLDFWANFEVGSSLPNVIRLYTIGQISLETLVILMDITEFDRKKGSQLRANPVYDDLNTLCENYRPFLVFDRKQYRRVVFDRFKN